ncbi:asparaginase [Ferrimonas gelatinilytica]|uniref:asparaginase n=1 Tax=Ferrimonas gelatinilytica TaxID=1255257 RepID=A0ABP9RX14_9GAMM
MQTEHRKRIYIAYTGGTIGMQRTEHGYAPVAGFLTDSVRANPEFHRPEMPEFELHEYEQLIDSSNMSPADWQLIADDIQCHYDEFDGFVILHGTDTMAFTASALSFMLEGLNKPVIVTGSQIPLAQLRSDGQQNLLNALYIAANYPIAEVCLFFNNVLLRGNRSTKVHADGFAAFDSPNMAPLLEAGIAIKLGPEYMAPQPGRTLQVHPITPQPIGVVTLYPGISIEVIANMLQQPVKALILQSYGVGNAPQREDLLSLLKEAQDREILVVNLTQCLQGKVNMAGYATGNALSRVGVISGYDMTIEAALAKLHYLLSRPLSFKERQQLMQQPLRGELSQ